VTVELFDQKLAASESVGANDRIWFPRWLRRYSQSFRGGPTKNLPVNREVVIQFSRGLLKNGAPAWQRWQAVRAIECYRDLVRQRSEPNLSEVILTLAKLGKSGLRKVWS
jgi:hypothetical protein